jgi:DNA replication protein DnaC
MVTSNKCFVDWGEVFNHRILAMAILDRVLHHATTVNIKRDSYRLREKKAGLPRAQAQTSQEPEEVGVGA